VIFRKGEADGGSVSGPDEASREVRAIKGGLGVRDRLGGEGFAFLQRGLGHSVDSKKPWVDRVGHHVDCDLLKGSGEEEGGR
jgi:hypothetical protein